MHGLYETERFVVMWLEYKKAPATPEREPKTNNKESKPISHLLKLSVTSQGLLVISSVVAF